MAEIVDCELSLFVFAIVVIIVVVLVTIIRFENKIQK